MILRIVLLFLLWLLIRRLWRMYFLPRTRPSSSKRPYPGPDRNGSGPEPGMKDITEQEISEADFEELDDRK